jgi:polyhydroxyalkanoate synthase
MPSTQFPGFDSDALERLRAEIERLARGAERGAQLATGKLQTRIAQTPKERIWALNKASLYHYYPQAPAATRHRVPLLLVFALINRPYIFDLRPGNSFVEYMLQQGYDLYLLDWGTAGPEDKDMRFEDYALDLLPRAIRKLKSHSGSPEFSLLGWCIGATIVTIYAALRQHEGLKNLILLTAPLDFSDRSAVPFSIWLDSQYFNVDGLLSTVENMPGEMIDWGNKMLKPYENFVGNYVRLWENLDNPSAVESWQAMNTWVNDLTPFAGAAFREWVIWFYRENRLMNGTLQMNGQRVDVSNITVPLLNVVATADHIVPNVQSLSIMERVGSAEKKLLKVQGGHIGIMAGSSARKRTWPQIDEWLAPRSD